MEVIAQKTLKEGKVGDRVQGIALISSYTTKPTKSGKKYMDGQMLSGSIIPFKVWSDNLAFSNLSECDFTDTPAYITGEFNEYQGVKYINVQTIQAVEGYTKMQFMEQKYPTQSYATALVTLAQSTITPKGFNLLNTVLFSNTELWSRFTEEFAAMSVHDNCLSGLLVHTYKVCSILTWVLSTYPQLCICDDTGVASADVKDILFIGAVLHDIGKVQELNFGVYQPNSAATHCVLGLDVLYQFRSDIEASYGVSGFRLLQSILVEHHNEYGDKCRTVLAYIVHMCDLLDARMTGLAQAIETQIQSDSTGYKVRFNGEMLSL